MPYYKTSQEWLEQSSLLMQAYPTSTRITTKYNITAPSKLKSRKRKPNVDDTEIPLPSTDATHSDAEVSPPKDAATSTTPLAVAPPVQPRASLTLKTYDPGSGICLKYRTDKAAEVGRLVASLGRLGRTTPAATPEKPETEDAVMTEAQGGEVGLTLPQGKQAQEDRRGGGAGGETKGGQAGAQGGQKKKKKKGKN